MEKVSIKKQKAREFFFIAHYERDSNLSYRITGSRKKISNVFYPYSECEIHFSEILSPVDKVNFLELAKLQIMGKGHEFVPIIEIMR